MANGKILILIIIFIISYSCKDDKSLITLNNDIIGNWYYVGENLNYQEFYFDGNKVYRYLDYSGDLLTYEYHIKNDSIYYCMSKIDIKNNCSTLFGLVSKYNSNSFKINNIILNKLNNKNDIESYVNGTIILDTLDKYVTIRKKQFINFDEIDENSYEINN